MKYRESRAPPDMARGRTAALRGRMTRTPGQLQRQSASLGRYTPLLDTTLRQEVGAGLACSALSFCV